MTKDPSSPEEANAGSAAEPDRATSPDATPNGTPAPSPPSRRWQRTPGTVRTYSGVLVLTVTVVALLVGPTLAIYGVDQPPFDEEPATYKIERRVLCGAVLSGSSTKPGGRSTGPTIESLYDTSSTEVIREARAGQDGEQCELARQQRTGVAILTSTLGLGLLGAGTLARTASRSPFRD